MDRAEYINIPNLPLFLKMPDRPCPGKQFSPILLNFSDTFDISKWKKRSVRNFCRIARPSSTYGKIQTIQWKLTRC